MTGPHNDDTPEGHLRLQIAAARRLRTNDPLQRQQIDDEIAAAEQRLAYLEKAAERPDALADDPYHRTRAEIDAESSRLRR